MNDDVIILWEAPKIIPPEFRLYYDDRGQVICYTCEKLEGQYIIIDALTYATARPDVRIIDGKISTVTPNAVVYKLMPSDDGIACAMDDISIISDLSINTVKWKLKIYDL
jgi:hypothetical protein